MPESIVKYLAKLEFEIDGIVDKADIIGAIFGQTEGLFGPEMNLNELQKNWKVGRIEISIQPHNGKGKGNVTIPMSTDISTVSLIAAAVEAIDKVGPCSSHFKLKSIEDVRALKREAIVARAKGIMKDWSAKSSSQGEDILKDGRKQYENGLPVESNPALVNTTSFGRVPSTQSLVYAFNADTSNRNIQDAGYDGLLDDQEANFYNNPGPDPALDNYQFYLEATGDILNRYYNYNNPQGNSPVQVGNNNRGSTTLPDVEDVDRDLTMNTVDSYFQYRIPIGPNIQRTDPFVTDIKEVEVETPNNDNYRVRWIQFKVPIDEYDEAIGGITDIRSISFMRMFMTGFNDPIVLRFGTLDLVRGDWRNYSQSLQPEDDPDPVHPPSQSLEAKTKHQPCGRRLPC